MILQIYSYNVLKGGTWKDEGTIGNNAMQGLQWGTVVFDHYIYIIGANFNQLEILDALTFKVVTRPNKISGKKWWFLSHS